MIPVPIVLAAPTARGLHALACQIAGAAPAAPAGLHRLARDLAAVDRPAHRFRTVLLARDGRDLAAAPAGVVDVDRCPAAGRLAFLFSGQSSQRPGMGEQLGQVFPQVDGTVERVCREADRGLPVPLRAVLRGDPPGLLDETEYTQPALLAVALALDGLLASAGIRPDLVCGHSFGEFAAAAAAGVWPVPDAVALAVERGRLIGGLPPGGAMVAIEAGEPDVAPVLRGTGVVFSAVHGPGSVVLAGPEGAVTGIAGVFAARGVRTATLAVGNAYHSPAVDPVLEPLRAAFGAVAARPPSVPLVGNATGRIADAPGDPGHWVRHCRETVRWSAVLDTLRAEGTRTYLEVGPSGVLSRLTAAALDPGERDAVVPVLTAEPDEVTAFLRALARLDARGHRVDWPAVLAAALDIRTAETGESR